MLMYAVTLKSEDGKQSVITCIHSDSPHNAKRLAELLFKPHKFEVDGEPVWIWKQRVDWWKAITGIAGVGVIAAAIYFGLGAWIDHVVGNRIDSTSKEQIAAAEKATTNAIENIKNQGFTTGFDALATEAVKLGQRVVMLRECLEGSQKEINEANRVQREMRETFDNVLSLHDKAKDLDKANLNLFFNALAEYTKEKTPEDKKKLIEVGAFAGLIKSKDGRLELLGDVNIKGNVGINGAFKVSGDITQSVESKNVRFAVGKSMRLGDLQNESKHNELQVDVFAQTITPDSNSDPNFNPNADPKAKTNPKPVWIYTAGDMRVSGTMSAQDFREQQDTFP